MSETKFTPGPWKWRGNQLASEHFTLIRDVRWWNGDHDANAHLIAAAPRMYGTLALAAERFRTYEQLHRAKGTPSGNDKAEANAAAAAEIEEVLAVARGEQP